MKQETDMRKFAIATLIALGALTGAAHASENKFNVDAPRDQWMTVEQVAAKFTAEGYKVREVGEEDGVYEVYAMDKDGKRAELYVHPVTGEILKRGGDN
jgi:hypothetical protein